MPRARVLWVVDTVDAAVGSFAGLLEIVRRLDRAAFDVLAVLPAPGACGRAFEACGVPVHYRPVVSSGRNLRYLRAVLSSGRLLRREAIDLVYFPDHNRWRPAELLAARRLGVPAVVHLRTPPGAGLVGDPTLRNARAIIGSSAAVLQPLRERLPGAAMRVAYPCIDFDRFGAGDDRRGEFFAPGTPIAGFVGMFRPEKGIEYFLDMAAILRAQCPAVRYLAVGDESPGAGRDWLAQMRRHAGARGVADVVHFTGLRTDIPEIMRTLDVLVVPSLCEGFGRVVVEANAVGVPVVAFDAWGIPEALEDGVTGVLVPPRDAAATAAAVQRVLDDDAWRARVAAVAPARVRARFSPAAQVQAIEATWRQALAA
jgi:glycosyltransferase involved in cell wall biosynthesis